MVHDEPTTCPALLMSVAIAAPAAEVAQVGHHAVLPEEARAWLRVPTTWPASLIPLAVPGAGREVGHRAVLPESWR